MKNIKIFIPIWIIALISIHTKFDKVIRKVSYKFHNNPNLIKALIKQESNFNPGATNFTKKERSVGLGQININAHTQYSEQELFDPENNITAMNIIIEDLKTRYKSVTDVISAYNAGRPIKNSKGVYINNTYVMNVYSRYLMYNVVNLGF